MDPVLSVQQKMGNALCALSLLHGLNTFRVYFCANERSFQWRPEGQAVLIVDICEMLLP